MVKLYLLLFFLLGTFFGSFYTVVGMRLPKKEKILVDRSRCDKCRHILHFYDMIPIVSYLLKRGRCSYCHEKIPVICPLIELASGILFAVAFYSYGFSYDLLIGIGIISLLLIILVSDLIYLIIPDEVLIFFSIYFIIIQLISNGLNKTLVQVATGIFLFLLMYMIMMLGNKIFKKESMGGGDVKLMFLFGLVLDPLLGTLTIFLGSFFALPISIFLYYKNRERVIPFGPFLLMAFAFIFFMKLTPMDVIHFLGF